MRHALAVLLLALGCAADPVLLPDAGPCGGACGPGTVCVAGTCATVDGGAVDGGADVASPMDAPPVDVADAPAATDEPAVDLGTDAPAADVQPEAAVDAGVDSGAPDVGLDAGTDTGAVDVPPPDVPCVAPRVVCAGGCRSVSGDPANCGACGVVCAAPFGTAAECTGGACGTSCLRGYVDCDGDRANGCEATLATDTRNCGGCGVRCADGQSCLSGVCRGCPTPMVACGGRCIPPDAVCGGRCPDLSSDISNCGRCGVVCPSGPNGTALCGAGVCRLACAVPFADCDGVASNGCEVNLSMRANCNACGAACPGTLQCNNVGTGAAPTFRCGCAGTPVTTMCGDRCANTLTEASNCGVCGRDCSLTQNCVNGVCTACGGVSVRCPGDDQCVDLSSSVRHCGVCGRDCEVGQSCVGGACRS